MPVSRDSTFDPRTKPIAPLLENSTGRAINIRSRRKQPVETWSRRVANRDLAFADPTPIPEDLAPKSLNIKDLAGIPAKLLIPSRQLKASMIRFS